MTREVRNQIWNLPLSHDGICGSGLEQNLKERVEMNKQISDLLPEVERKPKRKAHSPCNQPWKRQNKQTSTAILYVDQPSYCSSIGCTDNFVGQNVCVCVSANLPGSASSTVLKFYYRDIEPVVLKESSGQ